MLQAAGSHHFEQLVDLLIEWGSNPGVQTPTQGDTLLHLVVRFVPARLQESTIHKLVEAGCSRYAKNFVCPSVSYSMII